MGVLKALQHLQLVKDHPLVALNVLLQDDFDGHPAGRALGLANNAIGACTQSATEAISRPGGYGRVSALRGSIIATYWKYWQDGRTSYRSFRAARGGG